MLKSKAFQEVVFWLETIFLFTKSDYKTIFFPVMSGQAGFGVYIISACAASPPTKTSRLVDTAICRTKVGGLTIGSDSRKATRRFRWALLVLCLCLSVCHGTGVIASSAALSLVEIVHDDIGSGSDPILKNLVNVGGYLAFESGATSIMFSKVHFDRTSFIPLFVSGLLIFMVIRAQYFAHKGINGLGGVHRR